ncbi:hypothetical protein ACHAWU_005874 [Discostella pseudostelligera]|uniref:Uncharacterized protein n=1 Tax=Discostella pseudostelligera TaxID=259834 RepID=A0ABD3N659_9STRA
MMKYDLLVLFFSAIVVFANANDQIQEPDINSSVVANTNETILASLFAPPASEFAATTTSTNDVLSSESDATTTSSVSSSAASVLPVGLQAGATTESLKWSTDNVDYNQEMVHASNVTTPEAMNGKPAMVWLVENSQDSFNDPPGLNRTLLRRRLGYSNWTPCTCSSQCNNGCCSGKYSGGVLKCTPLTGGYRSDICVGSSGVGSSSTLPPPTPRPSLRPPKPTPRPSPRPPKPSPRPSLRPPTPPPTTREPDRVTTWACYQEDRRRYVSSVRVFAGHQPADGQRACNQSGRGCRGSRCSAVQVTKSHWNCYRLDDLKFLGQVTLTTGDLHWVQEGVDNCNREFSECGGNCLVTGAAHWDDDSNDWSCNAYKVSDGCSEGDQAARDALRYACDQHDYCYYGPIKNDFWDTYRHCTNLFYAEVRTKHWGLTDNIHTSGWFWKEGMVADPVWNGNPVLGPGFGNSFQDRQLASDWECFLGKSKPQGYDLAPCKAGGGCLAGTSCYDCCDGDSGNQCNKPWWEP